MRNTVRNTRNPAVLAARTRTQPTIMFRSRSFSVPVNFHTCSGMILLRDTNHTVAFWDGLHWQRLNRAGWAISFDAPFPDALAPGHWGVISPLKKRRSNHFAQMRIDLEILAWVLSGPEPLPDQLKERAEMYATA